MTRERASTSFVVLATRSPVPARSTVESGSSTTRSMNSSRSSAKIVSPMTNEARRANHVTTVCTTTAPAIQSARRLTTSSERPWLISSTSRPMTRGATRAATAATACSPMTTRMLPRWRRTRPRVCSLTEAMSATGSDRVDDGARRLDEHERVGPGEERAGQGEALALAAGEGPAALLDLVVEPAGQRLEHVVAARDREGLEDRGVVVVAPRVELGAQGAGEEPYVGLRGSEAAEPVGERRGLLGTRRHHDGEAARLDRDAAARVVEPGRAG